VTNTATELRPLCVIARDIKRNWPEPNYAAIPYLNAMFSLRSIQDNFYADTGQSVVLYFLTNATHWRGEEAKRLKAELRSMLKANGYPIK